MTYSPRRCVGTSCSCVARRLRPRRRPPETRARAPVAADSGSAAGAAAVAGGCSSPGTGNQRTGLEASDRDSPHSLRAD